MDRAPQSHAKEDSYILGYIKADGSKLTSLLDESFEGRRAILTSIDGGQLMVAEETAFLFDFVKNYSPEYGPTYKNGVPIYILRDIKNKEILIKLVVYMIHNKYEEEPEDMFAAMNDWENVFLSVDFDIVSKLLKAAMKLNIERLGRICAYKIRQIKVEETRQQQNFMRINGLAALYARPTALATFGYANREGRMIMLTTYDGGSFSVIECIARHLRPVREYLDMNEGIEDITLYIDNVDKETLNKVLHYVRRHLLDLGPELFFWPIKIEQWDKKFLETRELTTKVMTAAEDLGLEGLSNTCLMRYCLCLMQGPFNW